MTKRKIINLILLLLLSFSLVTVSYAWVSDSGLTSEIGVTGHLHKSYFESGDGSKEVTDDSEGPFEIKYPLQFYYLSWLHELGFFDDKQTYFYLSADIDMTGYTLPPVGSIDHPFLGNFDGKGHVISNLTVSDDKTTEKMNDKPEEDSTAKNPQILGVFGVVGDYDESSFLDAHTDYVYVQEENFVGNFGILNTTVETTAPYDGKSIIGIAIGYVNVPVTGIAVAGSKVSIGSSTSALALSENRSDYTVVGYCNPAYIDGLDIEYISESEMIARTLSYAASETGNSWGGSVDMYGIIKRLETLQGQITNKGAAIPWKDAYVKDEFIVENIATGTVDTYQSYSNVTFRSDSIYYASDGYETGAYYYRNNGSSPTHKMHINGYSDSQKGSLPGKNVSKVILEDEYIDGYQFISDSNYLNLSEDYSYLEGGTSSATATKWALTEDGYLFTYSGPIYSQNADNWLDHNGNRTVGAIIGGYDPYYLNAETDGYYLSDSGDTEWTYDNANGELYCTLDNVRYYLSYIDGDWVLDCKPVMLITDGNGNYLKVTSTGTTGFTNTQDASDASQFTASNTATNSGKISTTVGTTTVYLRRNGTALQLTTSNTQATSWNNDGSLYYDNNSYILIKDGKWQLGAKTANPTIGYKITDGTNYLNKTAGSAAIENGTNLANATVWIFSDMVTMSGYIRTGGNYYLRQNSNKNAVRITNNTTSNRTNWENVDGKLKQSGQNLYIRYNKGWVMTNSATNATTLQFLISYGESMLEESGTAPELVSSTSASLQVITKEDYVDRSGVVSYFPISIKGTGSGTNSEYYYVNEGNTGYFVGGSYDDKNYTSRTNGYIGDTRLGVYSNTIKSEFLTYSAGGTVSVNRLSTINKNNGSLANDRTDIDLTTFKSKDTSAHQYQRLESALQGFKDMLSRANDGYLYGLHFCRSLIDIDHVVTAQYAVVNGDKYYNFDLPECSLDFSLKEQGYINFFGGTYYGSSSNGFFSLHQVFRNNTWGKDSDGNDVVLESKIVAIKEIQYVFVDENDLTAPVIYLYKDGTFSDGYEYDPDEGIFEFTGNKRNINSTSFSVTNEEDVTYQYTIGFDTDWITAHDYNISTGSSNAELFYFEIPANAGEYCLGSFDNTDSKGSGDGEYLMYLDISAGSQICNRVETVEEFTVTRSTGTTPQGIQLVDTPTGTDLSEMVYEDYLDSASFKITGTGDYTISRSGSEVTVTKTGTGIYTNYINSDLTVTGTDDSSSGSDDPIATIHRIIDKDYNTVSKETTQFITTIIDTDDGRTVYVECYLLSQNGTAVDEPILIGNYSFTCDADTVIKYSYIYVKSSRMFSCLLYSDVDLTISATSVGDYITRINGIEVDAESTADIAITGESDLEGNLLEYVQTEHNSEIIFHLTGRAQEEGSIFDGDFYRFGVPVSTEIDSIDLTEAVEEEKFTVESYSYETVTVEINGDVTDIGITKDAIDSSTEITLEDISS